MRTQFRWLYNCAGFVALLLRDQESSIAVLTAMLAPVSFGALGIGIDIGYWTAVRLELQRAADLAALAGAQNYAATNSALSAATAAAGMAEINGGSGAASRTWNSQAKLLSDNQITAQIVEGVRQASDTAVKVTIHQTVPLWFSRLFLPQTTLTISASSWAELGLPTGAQACILALAGDGTGVTVGTDIDLIGNANIILYNCTLRSDASITVGGNATVSVASGIYAAGTISVGGSGSIGTSPAHPNSGQIPDPYANDSSLWNALNLLGSGGGAQGNSATLDPGTYSSLDFKSTVTLNPGLYVVNGPITFEANANVTGTGVTIVSNGSVTMNGQATVNLSAPGTTPSNGAIPGILYANPASGQNLKWNGGSSENLTGVFYAPNSTITINGNAGAGSTGCLEVIAAYVNINGTATFAGNCANLGAESFGSLPGKVALVQ